MIEVGLAISVATSAFSTLKQGIAVGKDLESMGKTLSKWAGAMSDLDYAEQEIKKPPWYQVLGGGVESQAMEVFAAKKQKESMRKELKQYISFMYGPATWDELLSIEAQIRKEKQAHEYRKMQIQQSIVEWCAGIALFVVLGGGLLGLTWLMTR